MKGDKGRKEGREIKKSPFYGTEGRKGDEGR